MKTDNLVSLVIATIIGIISIIVIRLRKKSAIMDLKGLKYAATSMVTKMIGMAKNTKCPLNITDSTRYDFRYQTGTIGRFVKFATIEHGLRACIKLLWFHYRYNNCNTIEKMVYKWAPPEDKNDTELYVKNVATGCDYPRDKVFDYNPRFVANLIIYMGKQECGFVPTEKQMKDAWELSQDKAQW